MTKRLRRTTALWLLGAVLVVLVGLRVLHEFGGLHARPTLVVFVSASAPLSRSFEETLSAAPVEQLVRASFTLRRLDAAREQELFRRYLGGAGALGSAVIDEGSRPEPDVVAVLPGYADVERFSEFLDGAAHHLGTLRALREKTKPSGAERLALGELYAQQGSFLRARQCFEAVHAPEPSFAAALERLARLDVEQGKPQSARAELERARNTSPPARADRLLVTDALILSSERRVGSAVALLIQSLPSLPAGEERAHGWLLLGALEHEIGQDERALAALEKARSETQDRAQQRAVSEQILHIQHPEPGHVH